MWVVDDSFHRIKADGNNQVELDMGFSPDMDAYFSGNSVCVLDDEMIEKIFIVALIISLLCMFFLGDNG